MNNKTSSKKMLLACVVGLFALAACASGTESDPTGRTWQLEELSGSPVLDGTIIDMTIADGSVSGSSGCNTYNGSAEIGESDSSMTLGPDFAVTFMACDQAIMDQEQKYFQDLARVVSYQMASEELILEDSNGIAVATFK